MSLKRNKQEVYEHVRNYFQSHPFGYRDDISSCVYIGHDGHQKVHCAIGCQLELSEDAWNKLAVDGAALRDLEEDTLAILEDVVGDPYTEDADLSEREMFIFQCDIQSMHDSAASAKQHKEMFIANLDHYAETQGLKVAS